jgi:hypothetical protein
MHPFEWAFGLAMLLLKEVTMRLAQLSVLVAALMSPQSPALHAQAAPDPSGHWEGSLQIPDGTVSVFQIDLATDAHGAFVGTLTMPSDHIAGLPLLRVQVEDTTITMAARDDQEMNGTIADDGQTIQGDLSVQRFSIPFSLSRTGGAKLDPPARNPRVARELEGSWTGMLNTPQGSLHLRLDIANGADGSASARIVNLDEGGLQIPAATIAQDGRRLALGLKAIGGSYRAVLSEDGRQLAGTYAEPRGSVPLTFAKAN